MPEAKPPLDAPRSQPIRVTNPISDQDLKLFLDDTVIKLASESGSNLGQAIEIQKLIELRAICRALQRIANSS
jgi:hypothetical protein